VTKALLGQLTTVWLCDAHFRQPIIFHLSNRCREQLAGETPNLQCNATSTSSLLSTSTCRACTPHYTCSCALCQVLEGRTAVSAARPAAAHARSPHHRQLCTIASTCQSSNHGYCSSCPIQFHEPSEPTDWRWYRQKRRGAG